MELPVAEQLVQFALCAALGAALGVVYDLLRALRKRWRRLTLGLDVLYSLTVLCALLLFALYAGRGELRLFMLPAIALGAVLYFFTFSRLLLPVFEWILRTLTAPWRLLRRFAQYFLKKFVKNMQKTVAFAKKIIIIKSRKKANHSAGGNSALFKQTPRKRRRTKPLKFKKTGLITKLLLLAVAVYAVVTLVSLQGQIKQKREDAARLNAQLEAAQQKNLSLQDDIAGVGTDEGVIKIARERLGMVDGGEIVFYDSDN